MAGTPAPLDELIRRYEVERQNLSEIGRAFGVSATAVKKRLAKAGIPIRREWGTAIRNPAPPKPPREKVIKPPREPKPKAIRPPRPRTYPARTPAQAPSGSLLRTAAIPDRPLPNGTAPLGVPASFSVNRISMTPQCVEQGRKIVGIFVTEHIAQDVAFGLNVSDPGDDIFVVVEGKKPGR